MATPERVLNKVLELNPNAYSDALAACFREDAEAAVKKLREMGVDTIIINLAVRYNAKVDAIKLVRAVIRDEDGRHIGLHAAKNAMEAIVNEHHGHNTPRLFAVGA